MTAAVEAAEVGYNVILVEKEAYLGGRVIRTYRYFPKMCPPTCGFEINARRIKQNPRITVYTLASVEEITGTAGNFKAMIKVNPRYVTGEYTPDDSIIEKISSERVNDFNLGMDKTKALYMPHEMAYPSQYVIDREALSDADAKKLKELCPAGTIDLGMMEEEIKVDVGAVIIATGWRPYDAINLDNLGFEKFPNIITNVQMERIASRSGPTKGKIVRPSDGIKAENIAFVQCAGSRDENHLPYCSAVCCMASLKQARYVREKNEKAKVTVFYIDIRTIGRLEKFFYDMLEDDNFAAFKGKVANIEEDPNTNNLILDVEDTLSGEIHHEGFDLVVLATGVVPNTDELNLPAGIEMDEYGFLDGSGENNGIFALGCAKHPCDVARTTKESTAAALKAIQSVRGGE